MTTKAQNDLLTEAKLMMLRHMPYYGMFVVGTEMAENPRIPTACTNYFRIEYNAEFLLGGQGKRKDLRPRDEVIFVLAHEVLHICFKHGLRMGFRMPELWNVACDYAINLILSDGKVGKYPEPDIDEKTGRPYPKLLDEKFRGMSAEMIYDLLEKERQKQGGGKSFRMGGVVIDLRSPDPGGMGGFERPVNADGSGLSEEQKRRLERSIDAKTSAAAAAAKSQGKLPAGLEIFLKSTLKPEIDWKERLRLFVARQFPSDMTYARPRKKFIWMDDIYLPSIEKQGVGPILFIMDTSGSVDYSNPKSEGAQYYAEGRAIHEDVMPEKLHVMYCDAEVAGFDTFDPGEEFTLKPRGGGGTDFRPPFLLAEKLDLNPQCAIYLTDMMGTFPDKAPPYPVLWVATTDLVAPWGETIRIMRRD